MQQALSRNTTMKFCLNIDFSSGQVSRSILPVQNFKSLAELSSNFSRCEISFVAPEDETPAIGITLSIEKNSSMLNRNPESV